MQTRRRLGRSLFAVLCALVASSGLASAAAIDLAKEWVSRIQPDVRADIDAVKAELAGGSEAETLTNLGLANQLSQCQVGACWAFAGAVVAESTNPTYLNNFAFSLMQISEDDDAIAVLEEALQREKRGVFYNNLARAYMHKKDCKRALELIREAIALEPGDEQWHMTRNEIIMSCPELMANPAVPQDATDELLKAIEDDLDEVLDYTIRAIDRVDEDLLGDIERCMELNRGLAERARAGEADGAYLERDDEAFEHVNRAIGRWPDNIRERNEQSKKELKDARAAVGQGHYILVPFQHDMFLSLCISKVVYHCWQYIMIHGSGTGLESLFWTEVLDPEDDTIAESYWMERACFAPHLEQWCGLWVKYGEERARIQEECNRKYEQAQSAAAQEAARKECERKFAEAEKAYHIGAGGILDAIYTSWEPWSLQTRQRWEEGVARWVADKWCYVDMARNCEFYLRGRFLTDYQAMPGSETVPFRPVHAPFLAPRQLLIEQASLGGSRGLEDMLNRYAKYARQKIEWCEPKASWPVTVNDQEEHFDPKSAVSKTQNYHKEELGQDKEDPRDYTDVQECLEAFFLNHVGTLMMDWKIKLGDAQFETKSDGTISYDAKIGSHSAVSVAAAAKYNVRSNAFRAEGRVQVSVGSILEGFLPDPRKKIAFKALHETAPPKLKAVLDTSVHASVAVSTQGETLLSGVGYKIPLIDFYEPISAKIPSTGKAEFTVAEIVSGIFGHMVPRMAP